MLVSTNGNPLLPYMGMAPLALAFERFLEARIFSTLKFERPILDLGCGEGLFAKIVFSDPIDTGIDPNPRELKRARQLRSHNELIRCYGDAVPKADSSYSTIFSNSVLEHIPNLEPVLLEVYRLLRPGGRFYVTVPSDKFDRFAAASQVLTRLRLDQLATRYRHFYNTFWKHYHFYPPKQWEALARRCGFEIHDCFTYAPARVCFVNDLLTYLSFGSFVVKKLTNRWTLFPNLRRCGIYPAYVVAKPFLEKSVHADEGGLLFMALGKTT